MNLVIFTMFNCLEYCFLSATDDASLLTVSSSFLTLNMKDLAIFQKVAISELLWLATHFTSKICFFISGVRLEAAILIL